MEFHINMEMGVFHGRSNNGDVAQMQLISYVLTGE